MSTNNENKWLTKEVEELCEVISSFKSKKDLANFMRDICTIKELKDISDRWQVCKMLNEGISYRQINEKTKISTTTITRISYWLHHGCGGYKKAIYRLKLKA